VNNLKEKAKELLLQQDFDCLAVGVVDFKSAKFDCFELTRDVQSIEPKYYFDLASVSKVLNLAACKLLHPKIFSSDMDLLLNHRSGLPSWGLLDHKSWKQVLKSFKIKEAATLYSDYGALRLMLEIEEKTGSKLVDLVSGYWDKELIFWKNLQASMHCPVTGTRHGSSITHEIHDPNAYVINDYTSHAGLFSTIGGLCQSMLNLNAQTSFVSLMTELDRKKDFRFYEGWDTVENPEQTLAGWGCSPATFGHLGFTGTSVWIDPKLQRGAVILSNATKNYWYAKDGINAVRKQLGELIWAL
jgi:CubicO group peptidase (beta-lactamase class C family)